MAHVKKLVNTIMIRLTNVCMNVADLFLIETGHFSKLLLVSPSLLALLFFYRSVIILFCIPVTFILAVYKYHPNGVTSPRSGAGDLSVLLQTQRRLYCPFYEELQAPNIRYHTIVLDQNYRSLIKALLLNISIHRTLIDFVAVNYFTEIQCVVIFFRIERGIIVFI